MKNMSCEPQPWVRCQETFMVYHLLNNPDEEYVDVYARLIVQ